MQNFIPRFEVATLQPPQTRLIPKLGGLPWGFPAEMWPHCRECRVPMALLAQLPHRGPALDFGDSRWVLHLFQCTTAGCSTWSYDEGCNAAFILPHEALGEGLTRAPQAVTERPVYASVAGSTPVDHAMHGELWITGWKEHEDTIPPHMTPAYFDPQTFGALPQEFQFSYDFDYRLRTKAGGVPYWTANGPGGVPEIPSQPFDYLMQIDTFLSISGRLPDPSAIGCDVYLQQANSQMETRPVPGAAKQENAPWSAGMANIMSNSQISDRMAPRMYSSIARQARQEPYSSGIAKPTARRSPDEHQQPAKEAKKLGQGRSNSHAPSQIDSRVPVWVTRRRFSHVSRKWYLKRCVWEDTVDHLKRVTNEFARQAQTFDHWAEKADDQVAARFRAALGDAGEGNLLDIACGPGVVTAAIAPGAASVIAFDATEQMLEKAKSRCAKAGLLNVDFRCGDAENLPFEDAQFDGVVTRLAVHHFADPQRALNEAFRVLRRGGTAVVVDVVSSEDADESDLQNAIERLRDPSHVRMLPSSELNACMSRAGFQNIEHTTWDKSREFKEWMAIINDPARTGPIRTVVRALAEAGRTAGMGLSIQNGQITFFHRWCLLRATKPL